MTAAPEGSASGWAAALVVAIGGFVVVSALSRIPFLASAPGAVIYSGLQLLAFGLVFCLVPVAVARAVLRHRLWDIDPVLNRPWSTAG